MLVCISHINWYSLSSVLQSTSAVCDILPILEFCLQRYSHYVLSNGRNHLKTKSQYHLGLSSLHKTVISSNMQGMRYILFLFLFFVCLLFVCLFFVCLFFFVADHIDQEYDYINYTLIISRSFEIFFTKDYV